MEDDRTGNRRRVPEVRRNVLNDDPPLPGQVQYRLDFRRGPYGPRIECEAGLAQDVLRKPGKDIARNVDVTQASRDQLRISRAIGKQSLPALTSGAARIVVTAAPFQKS